MNADSSKKKSKKAKHKHSMTTYPGPSDNKILNKITDNTIDCVKPQCSLTAKDSEWVDILGNTTHETNPKRNNKPTGEEIQFEDNHVKPIALMFPNLLLEDPTTLDGIANKTFSTTDVARHLVGHKANFSFIRKVDRLIPPDKKWLERLSENSNSYNSINITENNSLLSSSYSEPKKYDKEMNTSEDHNINSYSYDIKRYSSQ